MNKIEVSVIVPVYNVEKYLQKCLDSLVSQSLKNIEILVINDGSTDDSYQIMNKYNDAYDIIRIFTKKNSGLSDTRNFALAEARGEYISFIDSDDYIDKDMLRDMYKLAENNNLDMVICNYENFIDDNVIAVSNSKLVPGRIYNKTESIEKFLKGEITPNACDKIIRKGIFENNNIKFPSGLLHEDVLTTYRILSRCKSVSYIDKNYYKYRVRSNSITQALRVKNMEDLMYIIKEINSEFYMDEDCNVNKDWINSFNLYMFNVCVYMNANICSEQGNKMLLKYEKDYLNFTKLRMEKKELIKYYLYKLGVMNFIWKMKKDKKGGE